MNSLAKRKCIPCEGNVAPLVPAQAEELLKQLNPDWMLIDEARLLVKEFRFKDFAQAMNFAQEVGKIAEVEGHHPDLNIGWGRVAIELTTHAIEGLSENDFILAAKIDELEKK